MEQDFIGYFTGYGAVGVIAFYLFKNTMSNHQEQVKYLKDELSSSREDYKNELAQDRKAYLDSINKITSNLSEMTLKIDNIEDDIKEIKTKLEK